MIQHSQRLSQASHNQVRTLADRATAADGHCPLNEEALLDLDRGRGGYVTAESGPDLIGLAYVNADAAQIVVDPARRRQRVATRLLADIVRRQPTVELWAFGDLPPAQAFARQAGYQPVRALLVMELAASAVQRRTPVLPTDVRITGFQPADLDQLVSVNAAAFQHHPEQGRLTADDFTDRMAQPWFDPAGLLIARRDDGALVGFHWTKAEGGDGEVYVLGVDPAWSGHGIGKALLLAGLHHLVGRGVLSIRLWVEGDNTPARSLYDNSGFTVTSRDVRYRSLSVHVSAGDADV